LNTKKLTRSSVASRIPLRLLGPSSNTVGHSSPSSITALEQKARRGSGIQKNAIALPRQNIEDANKKATNVVSDPQLAGHFPNHPGEPQDVEGYFHF
jgi:hypothetical protein